MPTNVGSDHASGAMVAVDVHYGSRRASIACVTFHAWDQAVATDELTSLFEDPSPYEPGQFWKRELPCLLHGLDQLATPPNTVVIDGYVWLDGAGRRGLGAYLHEALERRVTIIGVAKTPFAGSPHAARVFRTESTRPLFVTAIGVEPGEAAARVERMHGSHRLPTLLKRADRLCRDLLQSSR